MLAFIGGVAGPSHAQLLKYDNEAQVMGAAAFSPQHTQYLLRGLVARCVAGGAEAHASGTQALARWEARHEAFARESLIVRQELTAMMKKSNASEKALEEFEEVTLPKMAATQLAHYMSPIDASPDASSKASICNSYARSIDEGKWDIARNDPPVAALLTKRIKQRLAAGAKP